MAIAVRNIARADSELIARMGAAGITTAPCDMGCFGDLLATSAMARGRETPITGAGVRMDLGELGLGIRDMRPRQAEKGFDYV